MRPIIISMVTIPSQASREFISTKTFEPDANLSPVDKPPKTITELKSDTLREKRIQEWKFSQNIKLEQSILTKRQKEIEQAGRRWWTGQVVAVSLMEPGGQPIAIVDSDEKTLLTVLFSVLAGKYANHHLVAKGGKDFYIPFLTGRALAHDLGLPPQLHNTYPISDIHEIFGRSSMSTQRGNLEDYSFAIGLKKKDNTETSQFLWDQYLLGNDSALNEIKHRCGEEAQVIGEILTRFQKRFVPPTEGKPQPVEQAEIPF